MRSIILSTCCSIIPIQQLKDLYQPLFYSKALSTSAKAHINGIADIAITILSTKYPKAIMPIYISSNIASNFDLPNLLKPKDLKDLMFKLVKTVLLITDMTSTCSDLLHNKLSLKTKLLELSIILCNLYEGSKLGIPLKKLLNKQTVILLVYYFAVLASIFSHYKKDSKETFFLFIQVIFSAFQIISNCQSKKIYPTIREMFLLTIKIQTLRNRLTTNTEQTSDVKVAEDFEDLEEVERQKTIKLIEDIEAKSTERKGKCTGEAYVGKIYKRFGKSSLAFNSTDPRPKFLIATSSYDHNCYFDPKHSRFMEFLNQAYDIKFLSANSMGDVESEVTTASKVHSNIAGLMIRAHGFHDFITFSTNCEDDFFYAHSGIFSELSSKSVIILDSCSTASDFLEDSIAYRLAQSSQLTTYAPNMEVNMDPVISVKDNELQVLFQKQYVCQYTHTIRFGNITEKIVPTKGLQRKHGYKPHFCSYAIKKQ
jgi:hypothetical protein